MEQGKLRQVFEKAIEAMVVTTPLLGPVASTLIESSRDAESASESGELARLTEEAQRQELSLQMARIQAQVAQELAIAHRIENAAEVEIEEYYEGSGSGGLSGGTDASGVNLALGGQGRKVTRRIYRFIGKTENT